MAYQVFARKLRPGTFDALVGQEHVVKALRHALDNDRLHHAYLFTGTRGVGKTTIARILAKCLNCEKGVSATPCGVCTNCKEIAEGRFMDLLEIDAASRTGVDDTRELLDNVQYRPARGRYKVYLIDEVHMLSKPSFNALLKTLEEPPDHVKFLLATTDPKKIPMTVLSRCLQFQLKNLLPERITQYLEQVLAEENIPYETEALKLIARNARGSMRDALSITDQAVSFCEANLTLSQLAEMLGTVGSGQLAPLLRALVKLDGSRVMNLCEELATGAVDYQDVLATLLGIFHKLAVFQAVGTAASDDMQLIKDLAAQTQPELVQLFYQITLMGSRDLHLAPDPRVGFEMTMLRLLAFQPESPGRDTLTTDGNKQTKPGLGKASNINTAKPEIPKTRTKNSLTPLVSKAASPKTVNNMHWHDLVVELKLEGVTRMLAEHSLLESADSSGWQLRIDKSHETLVNKTQIAKLQKAASALLGGEITIHVEIGKLDLETPAARRKRLTVERQAKAVQALQSDANIQSLISEFDAELNLNSIKPIESGG